MAIMTGQGEQHAPLKSPKGPALAHVAFAASVATPVFLLLVMMGVHIQALSYNVGFMLLTLDIGPKLAIATLAFAGLSLLVSLFMAPLRYGPWALAAVILSGAVLGGYAAYDKALKVYPPIYDVATNWDRPVSLSDALVAERGPNALPATDSPHVPRNESVEWGGKSVAAINAATCPQAQTYKGKIPTADQIAAMLNADKHYTVFGTAPWRVEAVYQDNFYGFRSDIIFRIDPDGVDIRSVGRDNPRDLGGDCRRVAALLDKLKAM
jgi:fatty-acyl-CoA synthase